MTPADGATFGVWRTPCEPVPRLAERLGLGPGDLWVKRDDLLTVGAGGNKLRKLEHLCDAAREESATALVACGAAQSNFCRLTAAVGPRVSLKVVLVLRGDSTGSGTGNLSLDALFGAEVRWAAADADAIHLEGLAHDVASELVGRGEHPYVLPFGGSNALAARGYVTAGEEITEEIGAVDHVVVAVGSGATMAGLVAALGAERVLGVDVGAVPNAGLRVTNILEQLEVRMPSAERGAWLRLDRSQIGPGYGAMTDAAREAMFNAGQTEGLILDPVYTAKAFAGLTAAVRSGEIKRGERTVFVHTGGLPGLYGHPFAAELATAID
jgi:L-cysteate sulfo-lyase